MTSRILFAVLLTVLGFSQCLHSTQATFIGADNTDVLPPAGFYKPYIVYRPTSSLQRTFGTVMGLLSIPFQLLMKIVTVPLLIIKFILMPIIFIKKIAMFLITLPLLPLKFFFKVIGTLLIPVRYIFG